MHYCIEKNSSEMQKKRLFLYSFYFIHIRRICDFICSSTFKKHQAGLLMYLQKNINVIMNVETDLFGSVLVNDAEDFFILHEYAILPASRCDEYSEFWPSTNDKSFKRLVSKEKVCELKLFLIRGVTNVFKNLMFDLKPQ